MLRSMIRKQLYIDDDLNRSLRRLAARSGRSEAEHVREALRVYLDGERVTTSVDPLDRLVGLVDDPHGPHDVADEHDRYLYGRAGAVAERR